MAKTIKFKNWIFLNIVVLTFSLIPVNFLWASDFAWECQIRYKVAGGGIQFLVGRLDLNGEGEVHCQDQRSQEEELNYPIRVQISAPLLAPRWAVGYLKYEGESQMFTLADMVPEKILGHYVLTSYTFSLYHGRGSFVGSKTELFNLSLPFSFYRTSGAGIDFGFSEMRIELDTEKM